MFSALSEGHGDLKNKLNLFVALCPIVNLGYSNDTLMTETSAHYDLIDKTLKEFDIQYISNPTKKTTNVENAFCKILPC
jgi:hypothetical protein